MHPNGVIAGLVASIGLALVITAAVRPGTQTGSVLNSLLHGAGYLESSSLGLAPTWTNA